LQRHKLWSFMWYWGLTWVDNLVTNVGWSEHLDKFGPSLGCLRSSMFHDLFHHEVDNRPKYMYGTLNLWLWWTTFVGKTFRLANKCCEFCDKKCAHLGCENCEKSNARSSWILYFRIIIPLSFTWCYEDLGVVFF
jgi:hypothetical protein